MENKKKVITLSVVFVLVILISVLSYNYIQNRYNNDEEPPSGENTSQPINAPDFVVYSSEDKKTESKVSLSDYLGKPVIINFWASWCGPCKAEMPVFNKYYKEIGDDVVFLMINLTDLSKETPESARKYIEKNGYEFDILYDLDFDAAATYGVSSIPATLFIDDKGIIKNSYLGALDETKFKNLLASIYEE